MRNRERVEPTWFEKARRKVKDTFYGVSVAVNHKLYPNGKKAASAGARRRKETGFIIFMLFIPVCNFLIFYVYCNFSSILLAFQQSNPDGSYFFTADNFVQVFQKLWKGGEMLNQSIRNTLIFFIFDNGVILPLSLFLSFFFYKRIALKSYFRFMFYVPSIVSSVVMTTLYKYLLDANGPVGMLYQALTHAESVPAFFNSKEYAMWALLFYNLWTGFSVNLLLIGGAMARIPDETVEAALLDGVGFWRELFSITFPMIWPTLSTIIICAASEVLTASGPVLLLTGGSGETYTLSYYIYDQVQLQNQYNAPAALGLVLTAFTFPIVMITRWLTGKVYADVEF